MFIYVLLHWICSRIFKEAVTINPFSSRKKKKKKDDQLIVLQEIKKKKATAYISIHYSIFKHHMITLKLSETKFIFFELHPPIPTERIHTQPAWKDKHLDSVNLWPQTNSTFIIRTVLWPILHTLQEDLLLQIEWLHIKRIIAENILMYSNDRLWHRGHWWDKHILQV